jgi:phosphatidylinositol alpha-1,6-mannosyltransferase
MSKKKVLLVTGVFPPGVGGMQAYYHYMCLHSKQAITVIANEYDNDAEFDANQPYPIMRGPFFKNEKVDAISFWRMWKMTKQVSQQMKPDMTIYGYILLGMIGLILKWRTGRKYMISTHGKDMLEFKNVPVMRSIVKLILNKADGILTNSEYTRNLILDYGVDPGKIELIYPGVDAAFLPAPKNDALVAKYGLQGRYVIVTTGRLVLRKGQDVVIEALPKIAEAIPNVSYLVIGDGPEMERLQRLAKQFGVEDRVVFTGNITEVPDMIDHYNISDQFIMVARVLKLQGTVEGFGIVYMEAASCKLSLISGDSGGVREAVLHEETGLNVDSTSPQAIADAIIDLYQNPDKKQRLIENAYSRAKTQFQYDYLANKMDEFIDKIAD